MRALTIALFCLALLSCRDKLIEPPQDLIPETEMTEILYDLALINGLRYTNAAILEKYGIETMPYIYKKYNIDSLRFVHSDQYYASVPAIYQKMYQSVMERLENHLDGIDKIREQKNDSLRAINQRVRDSLDKKPPSIKSRVPVKK